MPSLFTQDRPPKSGKAKKLWDWFVRETGSAPDSLSVNRPGHWQRSSGTPAYLIVSGPDEFHVNNASWIVENAHVEDASEGESSSGYSNRYFDEPPVVLFERKRARRLSAISTLAELLRKYG